MIINTQKFHNSRLVYFMDTERSAFEGFIESQHRRNDLENVIVENRQYTKPMNFKHLTEVETCWKYVQNPFSLDFEGTSS